MCSSNESPNLSVNFFVRAAIKYLLYIFFAFLFSSLGMWVCIFFNLQTRRDVCVCGCHCVVGFHFSVHMSQLIQSSCFLSLLFFVFRLNSNADELKYKAEWKLLACNRRSNDWPRCSIEGGLDRWRWRYLPHWYHRFRSLFSAFRRCSIILWSVGDGRRDLDTLWSTSLLSCFQLFQRQSVYL